MAQWLRRSIAAAEQATAHDSVRTSVEELLADIAAKGDVAVREMSAKFDGWDRSDFRLTDPEIHAWLSELRARVLDDIRFRRGMRSATAGGCASPHPNTTNTP